MPFDCLDMVWAQGSPLLGRSRFGGVILILALLGRVFDQVVMMGTAMMIDRSDEPW